MKLHEYQAKELLRGYGVPVPPGAVVTTPAAAQAAAATLGGTAWVLKAQIHAGGRGKAGGVVCCDAPEQLADHAQRLLGQRLMTAQTGPAGLPVERLLIEPVTAVARELYLTLTLDRAAARVMIVAAPAGGVDIETFAAQAPAQVSRVLLHPAVGVQPWQARRLGFALGLSAAQVTALSALLAALYRLLRERDAQLIEINPLVVTADGALRALDAKLEVDDNALYRQAELAAARDLGQEDPREAAARAQDLSYISLSGDIGCMVNGAGLAMATLDLIRHHGGAPANFLDVGGTATAARVSEAFKLILSDPKVKAVLINIFGGIVRCDLIAEGVIQAVREIDLSVPLVVRLAGTRAERGLELLAASGLPLATVGDLAAAAARVVAAARGAAS